LLQTYSHHFWHGTLGHLSTEGTEGSGDVGWMSALPRGIAAVAVGLLLGTGAVGLIDRSARALGWFVAALVAATMLAAIIAFFERWIGHRLAVGVTASGVVAGVALLSFRVVEELRRELVHLRATLPTAVERLESSSRFGSALRGFDLKSKTDRLLADLPNRLAGGSQANMARLAGSRLSAFLAGLVLTCFLCAGGRRSFQAVLAWLPERQGMLLNRHAFGQILERAHQRLGTMMLLSVARAGAGGLVLGVMFALAGIPAPSIFGLLFGFFLLVPGIGAGLVGVVAFATVIGFTKGGTTYSCLGGVVVVMTGNYIVTKQALRKGMIAIGPALGLAGVIIGAELGGIGTSLCVFFGVAFVACLWSEFARLKSFRHAASTARVLIEPDPLATRAGAPIRLAGRVKHPPMGLEAKRRWGPSAFDAGASDPACRSVQSTVRPGDEVGPEASDAGAKLSQPARPDARPPTARSVTSSYVQVVLVTGSLWVMARTGLAFAGKVHESLLLILVAVILGLAIDQVLAPLSAKLGDRRRLAIASFSLMLLLALLLSATLLAPIVSTKAKSFGAEIPKIAERLANLPFVGQKLSDGDVPANVQKWLHSLPQQISNNSSQAAKTLWGATDVALNVLLTMLTAYGFVADGPRLVRSLRRVFPPSARRTFDQSGRLIAEVVGRYFAGSLLVASLAGIMALIVGLALGVILAPIAALWIAATNLIPQVGGFLGGSVFVVLGFSTSTTIGLACLGYFLLYQQLENHLIQPAIIGKAVSLSPAATMMIALIGGSTFGVPGALIAIPVVGAIKTVTRLVAGDRAPASKATE
jgi:putative heme transporter